MMHEICFADPHTQATIRDNYLSHLPHPPLTKP